MDRTISPTAVRAGVSPDTLRFYERRGLLGPPPRTAAGYRVYEDDTIERIRFIKGAQRMGLRLREIQDLLEIRDRGACPCGHTRTLLQHRLSQIGAELGRLRALRRAVTAMLEGLDTCPPQPEGAWWCEAEFARRGGDHQ